MVSVEDGRKWKMFCLFFFKVTILVKQLVLPFPGDHAWVLCTRNNRSQDSKRAEETGDGRESNSKTVFTVTLSSITDILSRWHYLFSRQCYVIHVSKTVIKKQVITCSLERFRQAHASSRMANSCQILQWYSSSRLTQQQYDYLFIQLSIYAFTNQPPQKQRWCNDRLIFL